jgi:hypothetical protein
VGTGRELPEAEGELMTEERFVLDKDSTDGGWTSRAALRADDATWREPREGEGYDTSDLSRSHPSCVS